MADYQLIYWPVPFRGQFIRAILTYAGKSWDEVDASEIEALLTADPTDQPVPFMGPPVLIETESGFSLSQMPAIALHLGVSFGLVPEGAALRALTAKVVNDANDVIDELTLDGGREMWTPEKWKAFVPRLSRWMTFWEVLGVKHGLKADAGFLLGTDEAGVADIVTATLWSTMTDRFSSIADLLNRTAPQTAGLVERIQKLPPLVELRERSFKLYDDTYCGGQIEQSLRKVAGGR